MNNMDDTHTHTDAVANAYVAIHEYTINYNKKLYCILYKLWAIDYLFPISSPSYP